MRYNESFFPDEQLPPRPGLKVIHKNDPDFGLTDDEIQDRYEFIRCYLMKDFEVLFLIPRPDFKDDFFVAELNVTQQGYSAFNTHDFQNLHWPFNKYKYAMKKILERVKDLAIMHSCISRADDRRQVYERFQALLQRGFIDQVEDLARRLHLEESAARIRQIKRKISRLKVETFKCIAVWERYAPPDSGDT